MGSRALVIGNGESRRGFDIAALAGTHVLIGCNAIHRDLAVDHLVCCDQRMVKESLSNPSNKQTIIYVRSHWHHYFRKIEKNKNIKILPNLPYQARHRADNPEHWGSGPYALLVAAALGVNQIDIIGFDLYGKQGLVNNLYKDSCNYSTTASAAIDPSYWRYQVERIFHYYPQIQFNIINFPEWRCPIEWQKNNVDVLSFDIASQINTMYNNKSAAVSNGIHPAL